MLMGMLHHEWVGSEAKITVQGELDSKHWLRFGALLGGLVDDPDTLKLILDLSATKMDFHMAALLKDARRQWLEQGKSPDDFVFEPELSEEALIRLRGVIIGVSSCCTA